jgi:hypothetical protein
MWYFRKYVESLNIPLGTDFLNARNHVESDKEGDDKSLSLGMCMLIRPKCIYFPEHFCYCFFSNLCVLNTTNTD